MRNFIGMRFGRWIVISFDEEYYQRAKKDGWVCKCDCGSIKTVRGSTLKNGESQSCGCLQKELASKRHSKHSGFGTRLYNVWDSIRQRCNNPRNKAYHNYGGRGIKICSEWDDFDKFREWAFANGYDDSAKHGKCTLDRIDNDGMYSPDNCRWCSMKEQSQNKRDTIRIEYNGSVRTLSEWADETGIKYCTIWKRYSRGLTPEDILKEVI